VLWSATHVVEDHVEGRDAVRRDEEDGVAVLGRHVGVLQPGIVQVAHLAARNERQRQRRRGDGSGRHGGG
jgi:hypothetical protein